MCDHGGVDIMPSTNNSSDVKEAENNFPEVLRCNLNFEHCVNLVGGAIKGESWNGVTLNRG
jgi:hypothetical protein